ncbi:MAG: hypothetical protein US60_C0006G0005 [Microgenomates group bacterium GW2011_GWC1_37_8]|uniref:Uncharacterized protein n=2 Tax=Candidatus Woeseibacteriota TaxID=1752722 RepID=A0A0G0KZG0_9BACT|nr:MAG: hypothetical protein US60_C0006G0005 [Microgenomates group bacterium GW2011_GWC1_37_8]KKQ85078.1 MAG: hypothetical protein UT08_C0010G0005 [Candidatus Woesebacteria bacterium GW2011_GWB1_38_8]OGM21595.1 MAG: hypothetical protein A2863_04020 [Candidatus Woesebacteria bacterium RIFCSPHIGHO2_01_FULL_38_9b]
MNQIQATSIIRQRGQLTIPDSIRGTTSWIAPGSAVIVARVKADEIVIKPHLGEPKVVNWNKLWRNIELSRSHKGKFHGSLSQFIAEDRESRR